ncbi:hypothetical protein B0H67DRAFT_596337 [Lasiosphaeris hirsuta]|uniref:Uncharacterized protein n=1 Tax=Lasiosphaeris hirsuta TaxID=260670 RepID=A0AA40EAH7_9PEZI|nr:hypothetical protein B0H67DRAFT_596337 [Lasiosphaeris hirsuta]
MASTIEPRSRSAYTVEWVCALPKEQTASMAIMDAIHPILPKPPGDPNNYTLGSVGKHNIVIACVPKGQIGTNSTATVTTWMALTSSREWSKHTSSLNNPPTALPAALGKLESEHELTVTKIPEYLDGMGKKWLRLKYLNAPGDEGEHEGDEENCRYCDKTRILRRKPREARVHYDLIASGNQVIKDAVFRDKLNSNFGKQLSVRVIRGICDYADSHKNKALQEHTAAVAAALAKELLQ